MNRAKQNDDKIIKVTKQINKKWNKKKIFVHNILTKTRIFGINWKLKPFVVPEKNGLGRHRRTTKWS